MKVRVLFAECLGTALLVFFGAGAATLNFGFKIAGPSAAAGVVATAMVFGLVLLVLVYGIGPISGCHVNPAVTIGFLAARRIGVADALGYWGPSSSVASPVRRASTASSVPPRAIAPAWGSELTATASPP